MLLLIIEELIEVVDTEKEGFPLEVPKLFVIFVCFEIDIEAVAFCEKVDDEELEDEDLGEGFCFCCEWMTAEEGLGVVKPKFFFKPPPLPAGVEGAWAVLLLAAALDGMIGIEEEEEEEEEEAVVVVVVVVVVPEEVAAGFMTGFWWIFMAELGLPTADDVDAEPAVGFFWFFDAEF